MERAELATVDTHTCGEPTRILVDGFDATTLSGESVAARRDRFAADHDWIRELLMKEPRGHDDMFGAVPVPPAGEADAGVFFMDHDGYLDMCGHGLIGVVTALCETGRLGPEDALAVETPAGVVPTRPTVVDGRVEQVAIENVTSYVCARETVSVAGREIPVAVVYAGNYFAVVEAAAAGVSPCTTPVDSLVARGIAIRAAVNDRDLVDPLTGDPIAVAVTDLAEHGTDTEYSAAVFGDGSLDRSPCGTGTCARMTALHDEGRLAVGESHAVTGPAGGTFEGRLRDRRIEDGTTVVVPEVAGSAHRTGSHVFYRDPADDLGGFSLTEGRDGHTPASD